MKRFLVFGWDNYYPLGGMNDLRGQFDTLEEAKAFEQSLILNGVDGTDIIDIRTGNSTFADSIS